MRELRPQIEDWRRGGLDVALATVVRVAGGAPRGVGARMAISSRAEMAGSVSGGCVEWEVVEAALEVLKSGRARLLQFGIADEQGWNIGLACGGTIDVFVEPLPAWPDDDRPFALATVVRGREIGARLLLFPDGLSEGDLADPDLAERVAADARALLAEGRSATRAYASDRPGEEPVEVFIDAQVPAPTLVVVGATHTAIALSRIARVLGFRVKIVDARGAWATPERFPDVDEILTCWPDQAIEGMPIDRSTCVVVLTHEPRFDVPALKAALASEAGYVGAIGSRRTQADRVRRLREQGVDEPALARIRAPIGLDLGGGSPEEIALSIAAEMVAVRYGRELVPRPASPRDAGTRGRGDAGSGDAGATSSGRS